VAANAILIQTEEPRVPMLVIMGAQTVPLGVRKARSVQDLLVR
jgi:hypothetical protein